jgi:molybdate transport system substrate-binding protein
MSRRAWLLSSALLAANGCHEAPKERAVHVAAASDLTHAFEELGQRYTARTGEQVAFTFGSSGLLAKQIAEGAPFDLFAAANAEFVAQAVARAACDGSTKASYARGRVALWSRTGAPRIEALADLREARFARIALAHPEHAPYGKAAKEALERAGLWSAVEPRLVYGENVRQALQFAQSGNAEVAIVALALAQRTQGGRVLVLDEASHAPLEQTLVVCNHGHNARGARAFAAFVQSPEGREVMQRHGFLPKAESVVRGP